MNKQVRCINADGRPDLKVGKKYIVYEAGIDWNVRWYRLECIFHVVRQDRFKDYMKKLNRNIRVI